LKHRKGIRADIVYFLTQACSVLCFYIRSKTWLDHELPEAVQDIIDYNLHHGIGRLQRSYSSGQQAKLDTKGGKLFKGGKGKWSKGKGKSKKGGGKSSEPPWRRETGQWWQTTRGWHW
jgi:hypothetical protein